MDIRKEYQEWLTPLLEHAQYHLTLQTTVTCDRVRAGHEIAIWRSWRRLINRIDHYLYGNARRRKPDTCRILALPIMEGLAEPWNTEKTVHIHSIIGNIPSQESIEKLSIFIKNVWKTVDFGNEMTHFDKIYDVSGAVIYISKKVKKYKSWLGIEYSQFPHNISAK